MSESSLQFDTAGAFPLIDPRTTKRVISYVSIDESPKNFFHRGNAWHLPECFGTVARIIPREAVSILKYCLSLLVAGFIVACAAPVNLQAERQALIAADIRFDQLSGEIGPAKAFSAFLAVDALSLPRNGPAVTGLENIAKTLAGEYSLRWVPQDAFVSENADMGYTWGNWLLTVATDSGVLERKGKYLNVWVKRGGEWKVLVDIGNQADTLPE